ncbi:MAG: molybdopterin molybdotransferase MoeA [Gemmataceae bacterium]|nr:molybdopterin molybdotransferase MoeA [Gemmataceae bacterium]
MAEHGELLAVSDAQGIVLRHAQPLPPEETLLTPAALGLVLAEDVASDVDMPPFDKAMMDGYAVRAADLAPGAALAVIEEITAGQTPERTIGPGQAARIMTGAPIPGGADTVVQREWATPLAELRVRIDRPTQAGQNVMLRGREMRCGETVLGTGSVLRPQELGTLATVGRTRVMAHPAPRVAVLSTGDEIVEAHERPGPGQIRNGNGPTLLAQVQRAGGAPHYLGIARDNVASLRRLIGEGLQAHVLVLSGGVSAGKLDLVPGVFAELGVQAHFHKVAMKPGKPVFFGTRGSTLVFGLPGNPVSALVCLELFVRPAIRRLRGHEVAGAWMTEAALAEDFPYRTDRPTYHPARLERSSDGWRVRPVPWFGSPDLRGLTAANAFVVLPAGDHQHRAGQLFPVLRVEQEDA